MYGVVQVDHTLLQVALVAWVELLFGTGLTFIRVLACLVVGSIWTVPVGIWIGTSQSRMRLAQPIVQVLASFPAPMLYPLALVVIFIFRISFGFGATFH